jgi:hypothetical protein
MESLYGRIEITTIKSRVWFTPIGVDELGPLDSLPRIFWRGFNPSNTCTLFTVGREDWTKLVRTQRLLFFAVTVLVMGGMLPAPAFSASTVVESYSTWQRAALALDSEIRLYYPSFRAGLKQESRIDVLAFTRKTKSGNGVKYSSMLVTGSYKNRHGAFSLMEKQASATWAARRVVDPGQRIVSQRTIKMDARDTKVPSTIYANCAVPDPENAVEPKKVCSQADVKLFGGLLVMETAGGTSVIIESVGLTFQQLISIARGLKSLDAGN